MINCRLYDSFQLVADPNWLKRNYEWIPMRKGEELKNQFFEEFYDPEFWRFPGSENAWNTFQRYYNANCKKETFQVLAILYAATFGCKPDQICISLTR